jgi:hypothetical protein
MTTRIDTVPSVNGTVKATRKTNKPQAEKQTSAAQRRRHAAAEKAVVWSHRYTALAIVLSSSLNAYAGCQHTDGVAGKVAGAALGAAVPVLVWVLSRMTAWAYRAGWQRLAYVPGIVACALLALSVTHCASAFAALTGTSLLLSGCLAIGIDCGLVASETVGILVSAVE